MKVVIDILLYCGVLLILLGFFPKHSNFLDIREIIKNHIKLFKFQPLQIASVFVAPALIAIFVASNYFISISIIDSIIVILTILIAMFFSVMGILCGLPNSNTNKNYNDALNETFNSSLFETVLCILILVISFVLLVIGTFDDSLPLRIISGIIYYLLIVLLLNIFMLIKRIGILFENR